jgi:hypothetical protein
MMKFIALMGLGLFVAGCSDLDKYLPREVQCLGLDAVAKRAQEAGWTDVNAYKDQLVEAGVLVCPVPAEDVTVVD